MSLATVPHGLLIRCQTGDRDAFERLYGLIKLDLYRIVFSFMRDHDDTDEVIQESLIRIYKHLGSLKEIGKFSSWAMRILVNQCYTHRSRKGRHSYTQIEETIESEDQEVMFRHGAITNPRQELINKELLGRIHAAIDTLPKRQRMAVILFEIQGLSIKEVAHSMDCSAGAVKFNIHQGRRKMQKELKSDWDSLIARDSAKHGVEASGGAQEPSQK